MPPSNCHSNSAEESAGLDAVAGLFELHELPAPTRSAHFAVALPGPALRARPDFPDAALPESGRVASGRGPDPSSCQLSSIGEAVELASACAWGDERLLRSAARDLGPDVLTPEALTGFSRSQLRRRRDWNRRRGLFDWRPVRVPPNEPIDWVTAVDAYTGSTVLVPADCVYVGRAQAGDETAVAVADSNGCAAGPSGPVARLSALLELVERDATARWWYGRRSREPCPTSNLDAASALLDRLGRRKRSVRLVDISSDIDIPVMAAVSAEPDRRDVALGFAADLDADVAAASALTEMLQMELSLAAARAIGDAAGSWDEWRRTVSLDTPPLDGTARPPSDSRPRSRPDSADPLSTALDACAAVRADVWFVDLTRSLFGIPVFRAMSASLCHYKPRFARARLCATDPEDPAAAGSRRCPVPRPWLLV